MILFTSSHLLFYSDIDWWINIFIVNIMNLIYSISDPILGKWDFFLICLYIYIFLWKIGALTLHFMFWAVFKQDRKRVIIFYPFPKGRKVSLPCSYCSACFTSLSSLSSSVFFFVILKAFVFFGKSCSYIPLWRRCTLISFMDPVF